MGVHNQWLLLRRLVHTRHIQLGGFSWALLLRLALPGWLTWLIVESGSGKGGDETRSTPLNVVNDEGVYSLFGEVFG